MKSPNDPIRKKVQHDIAQDLDIGSDMFIDENEKRIGVQNIMTLFSDLKAAERYKRWARLYMTPFEFNAHWKSVMEVETTGDNLDEKPREDETGLTKFIKKIPCVSIRYGPDGRIKLTEVFGIDHRGSFYLKWSFLVTICCLVSSYMYLAMAAFRPRSEGGIRLALSIIFEIVFFIDICISFLLSFDDPDNADAVVRDVT